MKNIEISVIEEFNNSLETGQMPNNKEMIEQFIHVTIIHLEEDIKRVKDNTYLKELYKKALETEEKTLKKQPLSIDDFQKFNAYNSIKVTEIKWIAAATIALIIVAVVFHILTS